MSGQCEICGRGAKASFKRSHSRIATKRRHYLNLQTVKINGKKMRICTRCKKKIKKEKNN